MVKHEKNMTMEAYQAAKDHLSKSMLSDFSDCPARFKYLHIDGGDKEETPSLRLGSAVHTLALEPEKWKAEYYRMPQKEDGKEIVRNASHAAYKEQLAIAAGRIILTTKEYEQVEAMANAMAANPVAVALLKSPGFVESSILWEREGLKYRCRPDLMRNDGLIVDLKTARSAKPSFFFSDASSMDYDLSVALTAQGYEALHGTPPQEYVFLVIESEAPYIIEAYSTFETSELGISYHNYGLSRLTSLIERYRECKASNKWPAYSGKITPMKPPKWAIGE